MLVNVEEAAETVASATDSATDVPVVMDAMPAWPLKPYRPPMALFTEPILLPDAHTAPPSPVAVLLANVAPLTTSAEPGSAATAPPEPTTLAPPGWYVPVAVLPLNVVPPLMLQLQPGPHTSAPPCVPALPVKEPPEMVSPAPLTPVQLASCSAPPKPRPAAPGTLKLVFSSCV